MEFYPQVSEDADRLEAIVLAFAGGGWISSTRKTRKTLLTRMMKRLADSDFDPFVDLTRISSDDTVGLYLKEMSRVPL